MMNCLCRQYKIDSARDERGIAAEQRVGCAEIIEALEGKELSSNAQLTLDELRDNLDRIVEESTLELDAALKLEDTYCDGSCSSADDSH